MVRTEVLTYNPSNVIMLLSGWEISGWERIEISRNIPNFRQVRGIRGKNTRIRNSDTSASITIEAIQTELLHEVLSKILEADIAQGTARLEISFKEIGGSTVFSTKTAYVLGYPTMGYSVGISTRVWQLACDDSDIYVGSAVNQNVQSVQGFLSSVNNLINR